MNDRESKIVFECPSEDIALYIDGELLPDGVAALDLHLSGCATCRTELNEQKAFLLALSESLEGGHDFELPKNFVRSIVTQAESGVSGLRVKKERISAFVIISLLFLALFIVLGNEAANAFTPAASIMDQIGSVIGLISRLAYNVTYGASVFLRSILSGAAVGGFFAYLIAVSVFIFFVYALSRSVRRYFRT